MRRRRAPLRGGGTGSGVGKSGSPISMWTTSRRAPRARAQPSALPSHGTARSRRAACERRYVVIERPSEPGCKRRYRNPMRCRLPIAARVAGARASALFPGVAAAPPAAADIYKCRGDDSQPVYQDTPCPTGRELRNFQADPAERLGRAVRTAAAEAPPPPSPRPEAQQQVPNGDDETIVARQARHPPGNAGERRSCAPGMSDAEVLARVGPPDIKSGNSTAAEARAGRTCRPTAIRE